MTDHGSCPRCPTCESADTKVMLYPCDAVTAEGVRIRVNKESDAYHDTPATSAPTPSEEPDLVSRLYWQRELDARVADAVWKENRRCQDILSEMAHDERQREEMALRAGVRAIRHDH